MKRFLLILLYVFIFTVVALILCQLPHFIKDEVLFRDREEIILCLVAGIASGMIVGFFSTGTYEKNEK